MQTLNSLSRLNSSEHSSLKLSSYSQPYVKKLDAVKASVTSMMCMNECLPWHVSFQVKKKSRFPFSFLLNGFPHHSISQQSTDTDKYLRNNTRAFYAALYSLHSN